MSVQQVLQLTLDFAREQGSAVREGTMAGGDRGRGYDGAENEAGTGEKCPRMSVGPEPRYISPEERATLEQCLVRWRSEVEEDVAGEGRTSVPITCITVHLMSLSLKMNSRTCTCTCIFTVCMYMYMYTCIFTVYMYMYIYSLHVHVQWSHSNLDTLGNRPVLFQGQPKCTFIELSLISGYSDLTV